MMTKLISTALIVVLVAPIAAQAKGKCESMFKDGTPASIFVTIVKKIDTRLTEAGRHRTLHDRRQANQLRTDLFQLEAWARLHRNWPDEGERKMFIRLRDQTKELEDVLGAVDNANTLLAEASQRNIPALVRHLSDELHAREKDLKRVLRENDWMTNEGRTRTSKILEKLDDVKWLSTEEHVNYMRAEIANEIAAFEARFDSEIRPVLMRTKYDHDAVELFVHTWRRQIRWYAIYMQTSR
ncbi:MAG: hypothetical protein AAB250_07095, partial [Bdellovibrionota bacterium]